MCKIFGRADGRGCGAEEQPLGKGRKTEGLSAEELEPLVEEMGARAKATVETIAKLASDSIGKVEVEVAAKKMEGICRNLKSMGRTKPRAHFAEWVAQMIDESIGKIHRWTKEEHPASSPRSTRFLALAPGRTSFLLPSLRQGRTSFLASPPLLPGRTLFSPPPSRKDFFSCPHHTRKTSFLPPFH